MEKLELKHLAPYLPYGLKILYNHNKVNTFVEVLNNENWLYIDDKKDIYYTDFKPILRPLSDLTKDYNKEIHLKCPNVPNWQDFNQEWIDECCDLSETIIEYAVMEILLENHFDIFGLIEKGLAIDINTLK